MEYKEVLELCSQLEEYSDLEGSELGEACDGLIRLTRYLDYVTDEFGKELIKEIKSQLLNFKENSTIVERETTPIPHKYKELEWY